MPRHTIQALAFDAFVVFDPRGFFSELGRAFGQDGPAAIRAFRGRLFDYGWLRVLGGRYRDFSRLSADALDATASEFSTRLLARQRAHLLGLWHRLPPWQDAQIWIPKLRAQGLQLVVLSNWSPAMLQGAIEASRLPLRGLSTHRGKTYKPAPSAYELAMRELKLPKPSVGFVAFAAWDAAGAHWFGYPTLWMNRANTIEEQLDLSEVPRASSFQDPAFHEFLGRARNAGP